MNQDVVLFIYFYELIELLVLNTFTRIPTVILFKVYVCIIRIKIIN